MSLSPKRIALVLPYYNEQDYITPTLEAIAAQDTRDFRLIIVNNRSTDASPALVEAFRGRARQFAAANDGNRERVRP